MPWLQQEPIEHLTILPNMDIDIFLNETILCTAHISFSILCVYCVGEFGNFSRSPFQRIPKAYVNMDTGCTRLQELPISLRSIVSRI